MFIMKNKIFVSILILILIISCAMNIALYHYSISSYRQYKISQIDPTNSLHYAAFQALINQKKIRSFRIVFFGDSRISRWGPLPVIQDCDLINRGVSGETTAQSLLRIERDVISLKPDIVVIEAGVNDCNAIGVLPEMSDYIISNCKNNFKRIIDILHHNNIKTVVLTIFPIATVYPHRWPIWSEKTRDAIVGINTFLQHLNSSDVNVVNCDTIFLNNRKMKNDYADDMLHLNTYGYATLNNLIKPYLVKLVKDSKNKD